MKIKILLVTALCFYLQSGYSQESLSKKEQKELTLSENFKQLKKLIGSKNYEFVGLWMFPQGGKRVSMITPPNNVKIEGEKVTSNLPFIGTKQFLGGNNALMFEGNLEDYEVKINEKKRKINVFFKHNDGTESFRFSLEIMAGGSTNVIVSSNKRNTLSYSGNVQAISE